MVNKLINSVIWRTDCKSALAGVYSMRLDSSTMTGKEIEIRTKTGDTTDVRSWGPGNK